MSVTIENIFDANAKYENGRLVSLDREIRVTGLTSTNADAYIAELVNANVIPTVDVIIAGSKLRNAAYTIQLDEDVALGDALVRISFETFEEQDDVTFHGFSSVTQRQTEVDREGAALTVEHTYPEDAKGTLPDATQKAGKTDVQGGSLSVVLPVQGIRGSYRAQSADADAVLEKWVGHCNAGQFRGKPEYTWMCTGGRYELIDRSVTPNLFEFTFEFHYDPKGWDDATTIVYIDPTTNAPPPELVDGKGRKKIKYYPTVDFSQPNK
jgi:hypothetical protein